MSAQIINFAEYRNRRLPLPRWIEKQATLGDVLSSIKQGIADRRTINPNHNHYGFDAGEPNAFMRVWLKRVQKEQRP